MHIFKKSFLFFVIIILFSGCSNNNIPTQALNQKVDKKVFTKIDLGNGFYKYKNSVFFKDEKIIKADYNTFKVLDSKYFEKFNLHYGLDKNSAFLAVESGSFIYDVKIEGSDPETFQLLAGYYSRDKNSVFVATSDGSHVYMIKKADPNSFQLLGNYYTKDKNSVFFHNKIVTEADNSTFKYLGSKGLEDFKYLHYGLDKNSVFLSTRVDGIFKIKKADPNTFIPLDGNYSKDKNLVFTAVEFGGGVRFEPRISIVKKADPKTFKVLKAGYAKDKDSVFFSAYNGNEAKIVIGADPYTFQVLGSDFYAEAKDKNTTYYWGKKGRKKN